MFSAIRARNQGAGSSVAALLTMRLKSTGEYTCQAWIVSAISITACVFGIGAICVGIWQLIYVENFVLLVGTKMRNVYAGYAALGGFMVLCAILGICASLTRNTHGLLSYAVLMVASVVCQCGVWVFIFLERTEVSAGLLGNLEQYTIAQQLYQDFLQQELNCTFSAGTENLDTMETLLELCRQNIDNWFQTGVWVLLSLSATLVAFQVALLVTTLMLRRLVIEAHRRNRVSFIHVRPTNTAPDDQPHHRGNWHLAELQKQQSEEFPSPYTFPLPPPSCPCPCHKCVRTQKQVSLDTAPHRPPLCNCNCHKYESE